MKWCKEKYASYRLRDIQKKKRIGNKIRWSCYDSLFSFSLFRGKTVKPKRKSCLESIFSSKTKTYGQLDPIESSKKSSKELNSLLKEPTKLVHPKFPKMLKKAKTPAEERMPVLKKIMKDGEEEFVVVVPDIEE